VAGVSEAEAMAALAASGGGVKVALVMVLAGVDADVATARLAACGGRVRGAVARA